MEILKRTFTLRKKNPNPRTLLNSNSKPSPWNDDEKKVREGCCNFQVKYLGSIEVFESRGMQVCEEAMKQLLRHKSQKKSKRAILHVSGDALRVTEEISKGLIVDQVIEKVSFCAPDRNHVRGFAYICRDATTRRWLCHGFKAMKESGERLSHAVGCAFAVCLEKKQQREKDSVEVTFNESKTSFTRLGSFRQATMTERRLDPQSVIIAEPINNTDSAAKTMSNQSSIPRPHASQSALEKQSSMRMFPKLQEQNNPFKRNQSVRTPISSSNKENPNFQRNTSPIIELNENKYELFSTAKDTSSNHKDNNVNIREPNINTLFSNDPFSAAPINPAVHVKSASSVTNSISLSTAAKPLPINYFQPATPFDDLHSMDKNTNYFNNTLNNQYKYINGKSLTNWSDDILKPTYKEPDKEADKSANLSQKNPFDVMWINDQKNFNKINNHNTNPFKT